MPRFYSNAQKDAVTSWIEDPTEALKPEIYAAQHPAPK